MANRRALALSAPELIEIGNGDTLDLGSLVATGTGKFAGALFADGGLDRSVAAALAIGAANASAVNIGKAGAQTTILGDLQVNGVEVIVGGTTFQGNVTIGDGVGTDALLFNAASGRLGSAALPNVLWCKEVDHTFQVAPSTTAATAGGALAIQAGDGNGALGGNLSLDAGLGTTGGILSVGTVRAGSVIIGRAAINVQVNATSFQISASTGTIGILDGVSTGQTYGMLLSNSTAATPGNIQNSPGYMMTGAQDRAGSKRVDWLMQLVAVDGNADPGTLAFFGRYNLGAWGKHVDFATGTFGNPAIRGGTVSGTNIEFGTALLLSAANGDVLPGFSAGNPTRLGINTVPFYSIDVAWVDTIRGNQLTAAAIITPTTGFHHTTGATTVNTIAITNVPTASNALLCLVADTLLTWSAAGNIAVAGTLAAGLMQWFLWDANANLWYPQQ